MQRGAVDVVLVTGGWWGEVGNRRVGEGERGVLEDQEVCW